MCPIKLIRERQDFLSLSSFIGPAPFLAGLLFVLQLAQGAVSRHLRQRLDESPMSVLRCAVGTVR